jgi:hypothetical protein
LNFKKFIFNEITLYHGTVIDNKDSIAKYGITPGWLGHTGSFVNHFYNDIEPTDDDEIAYATDKKDLHKAINAMGFHISQKLKKSYHDVTENDIRNHGLIIIIKNGEDKTSKYDSSKDFIYGNSPVGLEDGRLLF